jgi:hypothetical protein
MDTPIRFGHDGARHHLSAFRRHSVGGPLPLRGVSVGVPPLLVRISSKRPRAGSPRSPDVTQPLRSAPPSGRLYDGRHTIRATCASRRSRRLSCSSSTTNTVRPWMSRQRNRHGGATDPRRNADDLHRHFRPTQAKTDASVCAWTAVDIKTVPVVAESAFKNFLRCGPYEIIGPLALLKFQIIQITEGVFHKNQNELEYLTNR